MRTLLLVALVLGLVATSARADGSAPSKDDEVGTISGTAIARGDGWIGIEIKDNTFRMTFYNAKKKPVAADASSAVLRWSVHYQPNPERTVLVPTGDAAVLASAYEVKAPHTFLLHILLLFDGKPDKSEDFTVNFSG